MKQLHKWFKKINYSQISGKFIKILIKWLKTYKFDINLN